MTITPKLTIAACCLALLTACSSKKNSEDDAEAAATPVQVAAAKSGTIQHTITAEAILYPVHQADIVPKISAPVEKFLAQRGDHVRAGQLLAVLEHRDLASAAEESKQSYEQAAATYEIATAATAPEDLAKAQGDAQSAQIARDAAKRVLESRQALLQQGAIARKSVDDAEVALAQAQAQADAAQRHLADLQRGANRQQVRAAQAQLGAAKAHYNSSAAQSAYADIRSPIAGVVSDRAAHIGGMASASAPLFTVVDLSEIAARVNLPASEALDVKPGQHATISAGDKTIEGSVRVVSPAADPNTTTIQIWIYAKNAGEALKPGLTAKVTIDAGEISNSVIIPTAAVLTSDEGGDRVMVAGSDGIAHEADVKLGAHDGDNVQVLSGLKPGDQVIVSGALGLEDKAKIEIAKDKPGADKE